MTRLPWETPTVTSDPRTGTEAREAAERLHAAARRGSYTRVSGEREYQARARALAQHDADRDAVLAALAPVPSRPEAGVAAVLAAHWWSATDDETCSCGWVAPMWAEACTGSDDEAEHAAVEVAHAAFLAHQTAAVLAALSVSPEAVWLRRKILEYLDQHEHHDSWGVTCAYTSGLRDLLAAPVPSPTDEAAAAAPRLVARSRALRSGLLGNGKTDVSLTALQRRAASAAVRTAWQVVDRTLRPLGHGGGASNSPWNAGYEHARRQALDALEHLGVDDVPIPAAPSPSAPTGEGMDTP